MKDTLYMNIETGSVDSYDGWFYENANGETVNAVDRGEVVQVSDDEITGNNYENLYI